MRGVFDNLTMADPSAIYAPDPSLVERFRADLAAMCGPGSDRLLVAVSGGADSLALLLLARAALGHLLSAATVDHHIRAGAGSEADIVAATCRALGVPHAVLRGRLPPRVGGSANLSAHARALRYGLLEEHRIATGCELVATAHHADDQL